MKKLKTYCGFFTLKYSNVIVDIIFKSQYQFSREGRFKFVHGYGSAELNSFNCVSNNKFSVKKL